MPNFAKLHQIPQQQMLCIHTTLCHVKRIAQMFQPQMMERSAPLSLMALLWKGLNCEQWLLRKWPLSSAPL
jgi:hypothetical protein